MSAKSKAQVELERRAAGARERKTLVRSAGLPVQESLSCPWPEFEARLTAAWKLSTSLANWAAHTLRAADVVRTPGMRQLPALAPLDLYALAFGRAREGKPRKAGRGPLPVTAPQYEGHELWEGAKISAASLLRMVDRKYRRERGKIVWRRELRTPEYVYPVPLPVHAQAWAVWFEDGGRFRPILACQLPGGGRVSLRLRGGPEFAPQVELLRRIEAGELKQMELKLDAQSTRRHCRYVESIDPRDGGHRRLAVMVRVSYAVDAPEPRRGPTAVLRTSGEPFLTLEVGDAPPAVWHCPWVRQWSIDHRRFLDRFADDLKFEKRWPSRQRRRRNRRQSSGCEKHDRRMKTWRQATAHQAVAAAVRRGCGKLVYDDSDRSFCEELEWFLLAKELQDECDENGLTFEAASGREMNGLACAGTGVNVVAV